MNICVVGAGAIGGWVAAKFALAGQEVSVLARGNTLQLLRAEGLETLPANLADRVQNQVQP